MRKKKENIVKYKDEGVIDNFIWTIKDKYKEYVDMSFE